MNTLWIRDWKVEILLFFIQIGSFVVFYYSLLAMSFLTTNGLFSIFHFSK